MDGREGEQRTGSAPFSTLSYPLSFHNNKCNVAHYLTHVPSRVRLSYPGSPVGEPLVGLLQGPLLRGARGRRRQRQARQGLPDPTEGRRLGLARGGGGALRGRLRRLRRPRPAAVHARGDHDGEVRVGQRQGRRVRLQTATEANHRSDPCIIRFMSNERALGYR